MEISSTHKEKHTENSMREMHSANKHWLILKYSEHKLANLQGGKNPMKQMASSGFPILCLPTY